LNGANLTVSHDAPRSQQPNTNIRYKKPHHTCKQIEGLTYHDIMVFYISICALPAFQCSVWLSTASHDWREFLSV